MIALDFFLFGSTTLCEFWPALLPVSIHSYFKLVFPVAEFHNFQITLYIFPTHSGYSFLSKSYGFPFRNFLS